MQIIRLACGMISTNPTIEVIMCDFIRHVTRHATAYDGIDTTGIEHDLMQIIRLACGMISTNPTIEVTMCDFIRHVTRHATAYNGIDTTGIDGDLLPIVRGVISDVMSYKSRYLINSRTHVSTSQKSQISGAVIYGAWVAHFYYGKLCTKPRKTR